MKEYRTGALRYFSFSAYEELGFVHHGFSTREGGVSEGYLKSMNFSFDRGDRPEHVRENYRRMAAAIAVEPDSFVVARQTHTTNIRVVTAEDRGAGVLRERPYHNIDGLMTDVPGITLVTYHADCIPVYFVDPMHRAIALVHAGWRGTVEGIQQRAVELMGEHYGTAAADLIIGIGPGICEDCYEVGEEVAEEFISCFGGDTEHILSAPHTKVGGTRHWQLNLKEANRRRLMRCGVQAARIHVTKLCTCCRSELFFSHRAAGVKRGLNAAFLAIQDTSQDLPHDKTLFSS